jgi:hypothetical protein
VTKRRKATIIVLPGVERRDLGVELSSRHIFEDAIEEGVVDAIVVGRGRAGELYVASAGADTDRVIGLLMRAATWLARSEVVQTEDE